MKSNIAFGIWIFTLLSMGIYLDIIPTLEKLGVDNWITKSSSYSSVDICRCLTESGNSEYMQNNGDACRDAISKELGVDNWEKVNFSKNVNLSAKFDALANKCK